MRFLDPQPVDREPQDIERRARHARAILTDPLFAEAVQEAQRGFLSEGLYLNPDRDHFRRAQGAEAVRQVLQQIESEFTPEDNEQP